MSDPTGPRPLRSVLYMPAANARALEKARGLPADGLIFDLEDAVAPDAKAMAREQAVAAAASGAYAPRTVVVRVNALSTPWGAEDARAAAGAGADAVLLPKVESRAQLDALSDVLEAAGAPAALRLWAMIETPRGVLDADAIAGHPRLAALVMGTSDLVVDLRARHTPDRAPLQAALSHVVLVARAHGLSVLDGVPLDLSADEAELERQFGQSRDMGFDGRSLIHPKQLAPANRVFAPAAAEVERAERIVAAFAEAEAEGRGLVVLDGQLIENLHVAEARRLLAAREAIAALEAAAA